MNCDVCWFANTMDSLVFTELPSASINSVQSPAIGIDSRYLIPKSGLFTFFDTLHCITSCHVASHHKQIFYRIMRCDMMTDIKNVLCCFGVFFKILYLISKIFLSDF